MAGEFAHSDFSLQSYADWRKAQLADFGGKLAGLFINDYTPIPGVTFADLTECNLSDYVRWNLGAVAWTRGVIAHVQILTPSNTALFTTTDPDGQLCYGYFIFNTSVDEIEWAQRFLTPQLLVLDVPLTFTPREKIKDCPDV